MSLRTGTPRLGGVAEKPELLLGTAAAGADDLMHPQTD
jgi:hypothetical protein